MSKTPAPAFNAGKDPAAIKHYTAANAERQAEAAKISGGAKVQLRDRRIGHVVEVVQSSLHGRILVVRIHGAPDARVAADAVTIIEHAQGGPGNLPGVRRTDRVDPDVEREADAGRGKRAAARGGRRQDGKGKGLRGL